MYLLDTNILAELRKGARCDDRVRLWSEAHAGDRHFLSVLSLGEIRKGIEMLRRKAPDQSAVFENWLSRIETDYEAEILPVTDRIADRWGRLAALQSSPVIDGLIAATALEHGLTVVTRNVMDFERSGVPLVNPFA